MSSLSTCHPCPRVTTVHVSQADDVGALSRPRVTPPATCQVHAEEARLQMVSERNKKLGANISRSELAALRTQVESPTAHERLITTSLTRNSLLII